MADQRLLALPDGTRVRIRATLPAASAAMADRINHHNVARRRPSADGRAVGAVHGMGGDVVWIEHGPRDTAPYRFDEFEIVEPTS
jgi:hypothetical protein